MSNIVESLYRVVDANFIDESISRNKINEDLQDEELLKSYGYNSISSYDKLMNDAKAVLEKRDRKEIKLYSHILWTFSYLFDLPEDKEFAMSKLRNKLNSEFYSEKAKANYRNESDKVLNHILDYIEKNFISFLDNALRIVAFREPYGNEAIAVRIYIGKNYGDGVNVRLTTDLNSLHQDSDVPKLEFHGFSDVDLFFLKESIYSDEALEKIEEKCLEVLSNNSLDINFKRKKKGLIFAWRGIDNSKDE